MSRLLWAALGGYVVWRYLGRPLGMSVIEPIPKGVINAGWGDWRDVHRKHLGVDVAAPAGAPVRAAAGGKVIEIQPADVGIEGKRVVVRSGEVVIRYLHLASIVVDLGQNVAPGDLLGTVGTTGNASEPHTHIDVSVSERLMKRFVSRYGQPTPPIPEPRGYGYLVPAETIIPAAMVSPEVRDKAKRRGVTIR